MIIPKMKMGRIKITEQNELFQTRFEEGYHLPDPLHVHHPDYLPKDPLPDPSDRQDSLAGDFSSIDPSLLEEYDGLVDLRLKLLWDSIAMIPFLLLAQFSAHLVA